MKYCISKQKKLDSPFFRPTPFLYSAVCIAIDHHCHLPQSVSFLPTCVASTSSRIPVRLNTNKRYDTDGVRHTFEHTEYITPTQTALLLNLLVLLHTFGLTTDFTVGLVDKAADRNRLSAVTNLTRLDLLASEMAWISFKIKSSAISPSSRWTMRNKGPSMTSDLSVSPFRPSKTRTTCSAAVVAIGLSRSAKISPSRGVPFCPKKLFPSISQVVGRFFLSATVRIAAAKRTEVTTKAGCRRARMYMVGQ
mmetsp:Transcript_9780/g.17872  ORF Transcript_9780/g.17872 Transcript_9780/m.17872 type:complete len:250 (-) Transcript_9780:169-918(-)